MTWKDVSTYGRLSAHREPRTFELRAGRLLVVVTRIPPKTGWFVRCAELNLIESIPYEDIAEAQRYASDRVRCELLAAANDLVGVRASDDTQRMTRVEMFGQVSP